MTATLDAPPLITPALLKHLFSDMLRVRASRPLAGVEAIDAAFAANLTDGDLVFLPRPSLMVPLLRRQSARELAAAAKLKEAAVPLEVATGVALAANLVPEGKKQVVIAGSTLKEAKSWDAALRFAGLRKLPIVFLLEETLTSPRRKGAADRLATAADAYGIPPMYVDGKDAIAVFRVAQEAIFRARNGGSPTLVVAQINATRAVSSTGLLSMLAGDALTLMREQLKSRDLWSEEWAKTVKALIAAELDGKTHRPSHGYRKAHHHRS